MLFNCLTDLYFAENIIMELAEIVLLASRCVVLANVASGAVDNDGDRLVLVLN